MAVTSIAAVAGATAAAAYLDAKFHIRNDWQHGRAANALREAGRFIAEKEAQDKLLVYHLIEEHAALNRPGHVFLEFEGVSWTYKVFYDILQRVGNWLMNDLGVAKGEVVALDGPNSPEFLMLWFALEGIGACPAFINCNLTGAALQHCVKLCDSRYLIADRSVEDLVEPCRDNLTTSHIGIIYFDSAFLRSCKNETPLPPSRRSGLAAEGMRHLIYTSGTTGHPKGTIILNGRTIHTAKAVADLLNLTLESKMYTCLPLYHGAAIGLCITPVIYAGATVSLGRKFSHKTFWPEVSASGANIIQYVGELCRYLVNAPPHPLERQHKVRKAWGNGMRPDVWEAFRQRFGIPIIHELYAATDGLGSSTNSNQGEFTRNAIALRGLLWHLDMGSHEVRAKIDPDTEELVRGPGGFAVKCAVGEPGEVLHRVEPSMKAAAFRGYYQNKKATEKRWLSDVFERGDLWFRSGDVMRLDEDGRLFFVDRLGDTFRWKSENVSTNEVADVLGLFPQIAECNVYGVSVPHADGRCGCAAVVLASSTQIETLDLAALTSHVIQRLPRYAVPLFLRITPNLSYTGTFKVQKGQAKREGIDLDAIASTGSTDRLFWLPPGKQSYVPFQKGDWETLKKGIIKL